MLSDLVAEGTGFLNEMDIAPSNRQLLLFAESRYAGQVWQIPVPLDHPELDPERLATLVCRFHELHERLYSVSSPAEPVEFLEWRLQAVGLVETTRGPAMRAVGEGRGEKRPVYLDGGFTQVDFYKTTSLPVGFEVNGPAVLSDMLTSNFVPDGSVATVTAEGGLLIEFDRS
ncbi:hypothetical protein ATY79_19315 [Rhizobium sp. R693]|nr:hypothetical protein ATY79_19315 [Rhizobium sp. R693]